MDSLSGFIPIIARINQGISFGCAEFEAFKLHLQINKIEFLTRSYDEDATECELPVGCDDFDVIMQYTVIKCVSKSGTVSFSDYSVMQ